MAACRPPCPTEAQEAIALVCALRLRRIDFCHIPNGGYRTAAEAAHIAAQGVLAGMPDYLILTPLVGGGRCWIELKRRFGSRVSPAQSRIHGILRDYGDVVIVAHGAKEALDEIKKLCFAKAKPASDHEATPPIRSARR